jgi:hypothetical protein
MWHLKWYENFDTSPFNQHCAVFVLIRCDSRYSPILGIVQTVAIQSKTIDQQFECFAAQCTYLGSPATLIPSACCVLSQFVQEHQVVPMVHVEGEKRRVEPNPNLIGSWRDSRLIAARTDVAAKPNTPRLPDWAAAPWKATSPPKGRSKVMSPRPPQTRRKQPGRRKEGGAKWVVEGRRKDEAGGDAAPRKIKPEHLHPATEQAIKASLTRAIAHRMTLYGHKVTDLESFFKAVDIDQSGGIDTEELHSAFKRLDAGFSNRQLDSLLITIGMNDDGLVSFSELKAWMERKASSFTPVGMQHGQGLELPAEPVAKEVLPDVGFESCMLPEVLRHRIRAPIRPAAVKPSDWHSPRASLTKHMGSHPKTPFNRLASGDNLRPVLTDGFADDLRAQDAIQQQQVSCTI